MSPEQHRRERIEQVNRKLFERLMAAGSRNVGSQCAEDIAADVAEHWSRLGWDVEIRPWADDEECKHRWVILKGI